MSGSEKRERRAERIVGEHLQRRQESIDGERLLGRVQDRLAAAPRQEPSKRPAQLQPASRRPRWWMAVSGSAIAALVLATWVLWSGPETAAAAVRDILRAHRQPIDRAYHVQFVPTADSPLLLRYLARHPAHLTTAGDRFVVETSGRHFKWGSEGNGTGLWAALPGSFGIRVSSEEAHDRLIERITDLRTLDLKRVLESLDLDYDLDLERRGDGRLAIRGTPRPGSMRPYSEVRLQTRPDGEVVERLELDASRDGRSIGTLTFSWREDVEPRDERYRLASYIDPSDPVIDRSGLPLLSALQKLASFLRGE